MKHRETSEIPAPGVDFVPAPVDDLFRLSVPVERIHTKDTTQVGPQETELHLHPGAWPIELRTRPDMSTVIDPADTPPPAPCPVCGLTSDIGVLYVEGTFVRAANYACAKGHVWSTKWLLGGAA